MTVHQQNGQADKEGQTNTIAAFLLLCAGKCYCQHTLTAHTAAICVHPDVAVGLKPATPDTMDLWPSPAGPLLSHIRATLATAKPTGSNTPEP